jgi:hypothetical protein
VWKKANPSLGITVGIDKVRRLRIGKAESRRGERLPAAPPKSMGQAGVRWMPMEKWDACAFPVE